MTSETGTNRSHLAILRGNNDGSFRAPLTTTLPNRDSEIAAADLDGDGHVDVVTTDAVAGRMNVLLGDGTGHFGAARSSVVDGAGRLLIADLNGDDVPDLVVASQTAGLLRALGDGDGTFGAFAPLTPGGAFDVAAGNLDGDQRLDLVMIDLVGSLAGVLRGN